MGCLWRCDGLNAGNRASIVQQCWSRIVRLLRHCWSIGSKDASKDAGNPNLHWFSILGGLMHQKDADKICQHAEAGTVQHR